MLVSVIVPVYNTENYLKKCIESLLNQNFYDYEIILVDDGSDEVCADLCDSFSDNNSNITTIHKSNGGLSSARKAGFLKATGTYICFVDSDDFVENNYLSSLYETISQNDAELGICSFTEQRGKVLIDFSYPFSTGEIRIKEDFVLPLVGQTVNGIHLPGFVWNKIYKRNLIQESYFKSEREYFMEDHIFNLEYSINVKKIAIINKPLYTYVLNPDSLTKKYRSNKWQMYKKLYLYLNTFLLQHYNEKIDVYAHSFLIDWFFDTIDNSVKLRSFPLFKQELINNMQDELFCHVFSSIHLSSLLFTYKISFILLKLHLLRVLYIIRLRQITSKVGK